LGVFSIASGKYMPRGEVKEAGNQEMQQNAVSFCKRKSEGVLNLNG
jgi:hypothetical protein